MRKKMKRHTWVALSFAALLLLPACGSAASNVSDTDPVVGGSDPTAAATVVGQESAATVSAQEREPAATSTVIEAEPTPVATVAASGTETEGGALSEDDRPSRLRSATSSWNTNWNKHIIQYDELLSGGPPRDGIPSIDDPKFISPDEAAEWLADNDPGGAEPVEAGPCASGGELAKWGGRPCVLRVSLTSTCTPGTTKARPGSGFPALWSCLTT